MARATSTLQIQRYRAKISGPLLDRIDIQVEVPAVRYKELANQTAGKTSDAIRARDLRRFCEPDAAAEKLLETAMLRLGLSARAYTRILKVARTIADLDANPRSGPRRWRRRFSIAAWTGRFTDPGFWVDSGALGPDRLHVGATKIISIHAQAHCALPVRSGVSLRR